MTSNEPHERPIKSSAAPNPGSRLDRRRFLQWSGALGITVGATGARRALAATASQGPSSLAKNLTARQEASRFLAQSTFGGDLAMIDEVTSAGPTAWLEAQMAVPADPVLPSIFELLDNPDFDEDNRFFDWLWWQQTFTGTDPVRQRVAFALSQIFVISRQIEVLFDDSTAVGAFWDVLTTHAFGNFRDLLLAVALQPSMGIYLSHLNNRRSDPSVNRFPDENFAREVMQLFSIGLLSSTLTVAKNWAPTGNRSPLTATRRSPKWPRSSPVSIWRWKRATPMSSAKSGIHCICP